MRNPSALVFAFLLFVVGSAVGLAVSPSVSAGNVQAGGPGASSEVQAMLADVPHLIEIDTEYHRQGVRVIGISLDAAIPTAVKSAVAAFGITYPVLVGGAEKIFDRTGIDGIPATLIIDAGGKVNQRLVGYHTKEEMLAPIKELLKKTRENRQL
jgi:hypothetical protein